MQMRKPFADHRILPFSPRLPAQYRSLCHDFSAHDCDHRGEWDLNDSDTQCNEHFLELIDDDFAVQQQYIVGQPFDCQLEPHHHPCLDDLGSLHFDVQCRGAPSVRQPRGARHSRSESGGICRPAGGRNSSALIFDPFFASSSIVGATSVHTVSHSRIENLDLYIAVRELPCVCP